MIRVLHVVGMMHYGGMESFIMNLYRQTDRSVIQFDFLTHHANRGEFEDEIEALGGHVYHTSITDDGNFIKYRQDLHRLFSEHPEYKIVHGHLGSMAYWYLGEAKRHGVPWRILHSHVPSYVKSIKGYAKNALFLFSPHYANISFACSPEAGKYQFRKKPFEIIPNGIDVARFRYDEETRNRVRKELNIENRFVVGHVGRFFPEKNHAYLIRVFQELRKKKSDAVLMLVGGGYLFDKIQQQVKALGLEDSVLFMGLQEDTAPFYQAMDAFALPSLYEGFPLTGIEAQCAGLPCLFTSHTTSEIVLRSDSRQLPVEEDDVWKWVEALEKIRDTKRNRNELPPKMDVYDSSKIAANLADRYRELWENCT